MSLRHEITSAHRVLQGMEILAQILRASEHLEFQRKGVFVKLVQNH
jgi:hypothetical protein